MQQFLTEFSVLTVRQAGWSGKKNGELLRLANEKFDVLLTVDKGIKYQNNFTGLQISVVQMFIPTNRIGDILPILSLVKTAIRICEPGQIIPVKRE